MVKKILYDKDENFDLIKVTSINDFMAYDKEEGIARGLNSYRYDVNVFCEFGYDGTLPAYFEIKYVNDFGWTLTQVDNLKEWATEYANRYENKANEYRKFAKSLN